MSDNLTQQSTLRASPSKLRARWVFPISSPPIADGIVEVKDDRIVSVRQASAADQSVERLDVALFPGLVNAHTHLEFSDLEEPIGHPEIPLHEWIREVVRARQSVSATNPETAIAKGMKECLDAATALVGEIATTPWNHPSINGLQVVAFAEVLGLSEERAEDRLSRAIEHSDRLARLEYKERGLYPAISPHAPYSTPMSLIEKCVAYASLCDIPLAMHMAESQEERELLEYGRGGFASALSEMGLPTDQWFGESHRQSIMSVLQVLAKAPRAALIHGNYFDDEEIGFIADHPSLSVVMCPRTHSFFGHSRHRIDQMLAAGVNVALGTDSRASNPDLSVWREAQFLLKHRQDLPPASVFQCVTLGGSKTLGQDSQLGSLETGKLARFALVPTVADHLETVYADCALTDAVAASVLGL